MATGDCSGLFSQILGQIDFEGLRKNKDATWRIGIVVVLRTRSVLASSCFFRLNLANVNRGADAGEREKLTDSILRQSQATVGSWDRPRRLRAIFTR